MKQKIFSFLLLVVISFVSLTSATHAAGSLKDAMTNLGTAGKKAGTSETQVDVVAGQIIFTALSFVGLIFLVLTVYAGYLWMTARGDSGQIEKAQEIIKAAVIGLIVVMSAYAITALVTSRLGQVG